MKTPSSNWLNRLILTIQECNAETGVGFSEFLVETLEGLSFNTPDYSLVQHIKFKFDMERMRQEAERDMHPELPRGSRSPKHYS